MPGNPHYILTHHLKQTIATAMRAGMPVEDVIATLAEMQRALEHPMYRAALAVIETTKRGQA